MEKQLKLIRSRRYEHYLGQRGAGNGKTTQRASDFSISKRERPFVGSFHIIYDVRTKKGKGVVKKSNTLNLRTINTSFEGRRRGVAAE